MKITVPSLVIGAVAIAVLAPSTANYQFISFMMVAGAVIIGIIHK